MHNTRLSNRIFALVNYIAIMTYRVWFCTRTTECKSTYISPKIPLITFKQFHVYIYNTHICNLIYKKKLRSALNRILVKLVSYAIRTQKKNSHGLLLIARYNS